ncbi:nuclease-related domain-containing protein [Singulisphaera sp. Ch08]|uniref:Nuclease-related domain-containing protein n=1 Tax=Singulisphaera sp. Ch08 TaxID=3120278 RepID=A0AAU7CJK4_9BACT
MKTTIDLFIGSPIEHDSEKDFLEQLSAEFHARHQPALVFANFFPLRNPHQIDFLVVTASCACHVELKRLTAPVVGGLNGLWSLRRPDGSLMPLEAKNPYRQTLDGKLAISDEMHAFARTNPSLPVLAPGAKFFKHLESVVCVFPELLPGSSIPDDHKVRSRGFQGLLKLFDERNTHPPGWSRETWIAFAMHLNLTRIDEADERLPLEAKEARRVVSEYANRFESYIAKELPPLIPTNIRQTDGTTVLSSTITDNLLRGTHIQLIGSSGLGKSLLAKHMAIASLRGGRIPVVASAIDYEGKLSTLLDRSIAHLHPDTALHLLNAINRNGSPLALVIDGVNECPRRWRKDLLKDLQAFYLRWRVPILITAQESPELTECLTGDCYCLEPLTSIQRRAVLGSYLDSEPSEEIFTLCEPFKTPYELSIAAECLSEIGGPTTRALLFEAYAGNRCQRSECPAIVRSVICGLAELMQRRFVSTLTMNEVWRVAHGVLTKEGDRSQLVTDVLACGLLDVRQNRCAFRHEILERFFQAEAFTRRHPAPDELANAIALPRHRPLVEFVLGAEGDEASIRECLGALADWRILGDCLRGRFGETARNVARSECVRLLHAAESALQGIDVELEGSDGMKLLTITRGPRWTTYECALMNAIGDVLPEGQFLDAFLGLLRQTEKVCRWILADKPGAHGCLRPGDATWIFASLFEILRGGDAPYFPVSVIYHKARFSFGCRTDQDTPDSIVALASNLSDRLPGELLLLCRHLRNATPELASISPSLVRVCWETRIYHLRLEALDFAAMVSTFLDPAGREEMAILLSSLSTNNILLNTAIVDAMMSYDMLQPIIGADEAAATIADILRIPDDAEAQHRANVAVSNVFEDVYQGVYWDAIEDLGRESRVQLFTMAALGAPVYGMFTDWVLNRLIELGDCAALPAFDRWCSPPAADCMCLQDATACFVAAIIGRTAFVSEPPSRSVSVTNDHRAWMIYGEILHWSFHPKLMESEKAAACAPLWKEIRTELLLEAIDPLYQLGQIADARPDRQRPVLEAWCKLFPDEIRQILEFGLAKRDHLTSQFPGRYHTEGRVGFMIRWLGWIGDPQSLITIEPLVDSPSFGLDAIEAVRSIKSDGRLGERNAASKRLG